MFLSPFFVTAIIVLINLGLTLQIPTIILVAALLFIILAAGLLIWLGSKIAKAMDPDLHIFLKDKII